MASQPTIYYYEQTEMVCVTCGHAVMYTGQGVCSRCLTPMELTRSVSLRENPQKFMLVLGQSGAGKTVFLGMLLDMLCRGHGDLRGLANDAFSVSIQQQTITALEQQQFPEKTPSEADDWKWLHCDVHKTSNPKKSVDIITPDLAGEAIAQEIESPGTFPTIRNAMRNANGILLLFDSEKVRDQGRGEDLFGIKAVSYLAGLQLEEQRRRVKKLKVPLSIVFTKADCCSDAQQDPRRFAQEHMPGMYQMCEKKFSHFEFFAASVVGSKATLVGNNFAQKEVALHIQPTGIIEPVAWVFNQMGKRA